MAIGTSRMGGVTRRGVLGGAAALGFGAAVGPFGFGSAHAAPKKGGNFRCALGHGATSDSLDPATWTDLYMQLVGAGMHNYLTEVAADGSLIGEVAESWDTSDAKTWKFKIRSGVTFHNGKPVTAADVIASINHHRGEDSKSAAKPLLAPIESMTDDGGDFVLTLSAANADFPFILSDYHMPIMPAVDGKVDALGVIGCGGYVLENFEPGVRTTLKRNPDYWKADRAHFDSLELLAIIDATARTNALVTGEVDAIASVDVNTVPLLKRAQNINIVTAAGNGHYVFVMDCRAAPFNNQDVRLALKYAIDREQQVQKILNGFGVAGNDHPIGRSNQFFATGLEQRVFDPEKSKFHLKKAGLDSLTVDLSAAPSAFTGAVDAAVLYAESAAACGITINVVREPNDGYWSNVWMKKPFCASYWGGRPTEDWMFSTAYAAGAEWNESFWDNARFNELLIAARAELDQDKRRAMYGEMQELCNVDGGTVTPMFNSYVMATSNAIATPEKIGANWEMDGFRAVERWWFA